MEFEATIKIPDDVWENRCRWCVHRIRDENMTVERSRIWNASYRDRLPCRIIGIAMHSLIPGECKSFHPNWVYGICETCEHNNMFAEGFCRAECQPNKRKVFVGEGYGNPAYWAEHALSTCDNYTPNPNYFDGMRKQAVDGKIPRNFDPVTMEPTDTLDPTKWAATEANLSALDEKIRKEKERARIFREAERDGQIPGQQRMDI